MGKLEMIVYSTGAKTIGISDYKNNLTICQNGIPIPPSEARTCIKSDYSIPNPIISYRIFIIESPAGETNKNKTLYKAVKMRSSYGCEVPVFWSHHLFPTLKEWQYTTRTLVALVG